MTLPKKQTRKIVVSGETYLWHRANHFWWENHWIVIQKAESTGQMLMLDPYAHDISAGPDPVRLVIEFALQHGWTPDIKAAPIKLRYNGYNFPEDLFIRLPNDAQPGGHGDSTERLKERETSRFVFQRKLGAWVKQQRQDRQWSAEELNSKLAGLMTGWESVSGLEAGGMLISWPMLSRLSQIFEVTPEQLLSIVELEDPASILYFGLLPIETKQSILQAIGKKHTS